MLVEKDRFLQVPMFRSTDPQDQFLNFILHPFLIHRHRLFVQMAAVGVVLLTKMVYPVVLVVAADKKIVKERHSQGEQVTHLLLHPLKVIPVVLDQEALPPVILEEEEVALAPPEETLLLLKQVAAALDLPLELKGLLIHMRVAAALVQHLEGFKQEMVVQAVQVAVQETL